jgi:hypothetical protein
VLQVWVALGFVFPAHSASLFATFSMPSAAQITERCCSPEPHAFEQGSHADAKYLNTGHELVLHALSVDGFTKLALVQLPSSRGALLLAESTHMGVRVWLGRPSIAPSTQVAEQALHSGSVHAGTVQATKGTHSFDSSGLLDAGQESFSSLVSGFRHSTVRDTARSSHWHSSKLDANHSGQASFASLLHGSSVSSFSTGHNASATTSTVLSVFFLTHERVAVLTPPPHDVEQSVQEPRCQLCALSHASALTLHGSESAGLSPHKAASAEIAETPV